MVYERVIEGRYVRLRTVELEDAEYTLAIRQDEKKNRYLHKVDNDINKQLAWLKEQRQRPGDYFFIAEKPDGTKLGTISVYDVRGERGILGRLLMFGNPFQTFEATLLAMDFAYYTLGLQELIGIVEFGNEPSLRLSEAVGIRFSKERFLEENGRRSYLGVAFRSEYPQFAGDIKKLIYRDVT